MHSHERPKTAAIAEVEVESVAFVVLDALGLASDDYSFPYVMRWAGGDIELVKQSAKRAVSRAKQILGPLETTPDGVSTDDIRTDIITT